jgi:hypothetical protein
VYLGVVPPDVDVVGLHPPGDVHAGLRDLQPVPPHNLDVFLRVEGLGAEVLVPDEDVLIRRHDAWVHEPLGVPPTLVRISSHHCCSVSGNHDQAQ